MLCFWKSRTRNYIPLQGILRGRQEWFWHVLKMQKDLGTRGPVRPTPRGEQPAPRLPGPCSGQPALPRPARGSSQLYVLTPAWTRAARPVLPV